MLGCYNPDCWIFVIVSIVIVCIYLLVAAKVAPLYGASLEYEDVALVPFRLVKLLKTKQTTGVILCQLPTG